MKNYTNLIIVLLFSVLIAPSCRHIRFVTFNVMQPAQITFPPNVNKLLIVDRTKFKKNKKTVGIIEGVLTGEMPGQDKADEQELINALQQTLLTSPRFMVQRATEVLAGNSLTQVFPEPISWDTIEYLCKKYDADVVVALEIFDTDFIITNGKRVKKQNVQVAGINQEINVDEFYAQGLGRVKAGFKIYDPNGKIIVDQQLYTTTNTWEGSGSTIVAALMQLIAETQATKYVSQTAGSNYAYKIIPTPVSVTREFYSRGHVKRIADGRRMADMNDWDNAIKTWESGLQLARRRDAGRICYDIAIAYEVLGDLDNAKKWATRSYVDYRNKKALNYSSILNNRIYNQQVVDQQMK